MNRSAPHYSPNGSFIPWKWTLFIIGFLLFRQANARIIKPHFITLERSIAQADTIPTTVPAKGKWIHPDSIPKPIVIRTGKPKIVPAHPNVHPIGKPKIVPVPEELPVFTPGEGDSPLPHTPEVKITVVPARHPQPTPALPPRMKQNAAYDIQYLNVDQGLAVVNMIAMIEDRRGHFWIGTVGDGVNCFDGVSFRQYTETQGLANNYVWSIFEDSKGNIWFGHSSGLASCFDGRNFTHYKIGGFVRSILEDKRGHLWFGTSWGLVQYNGTDFKRHWIQKDVIHNNVWNLLEDKNGNLWIGTATGLYCFDGKHFLQFTENEGLSHNRVWSIFEDSNGNLWIGTSKGVNLFNGKSFTHFMDNKGPNNEFIWDIIEDHQGHIWFATQHNGASRFDGKSFTYFTEKEGLNSNAVRAIIEDSEDKLWFSMATGGISRYNPNSFTHYSVKEGLFSDVIQIVKEDSQGNLWFGGLGACRYDGKNFTYFTKREGLKVGGMFAITEDKQGNIWFGGNGLSCYDGKNFIDYSEIKEFGLYYSWVITEDREGNLWFGNNTKGVNRYDGKNFLHFDKTAGLNHNNIQAIAEDQQGHFWIGTYGGGINYYDGESFRYYTMNEGLSNRFITNIFEDSRGGLWIATEEGGINHFDPDNDQAGFTHFTIKEGLSHHFSMSILEDKQHNIWVSTKKGISLISPNQNQTSFEKDSQSRNFQVRTVFGTEDGLNSLDFWLGELDSQNRLWWGTSKGVTMLDLNKFKLPSQPPHIALTHIEVKQNFIDFQSLSDTTYRNTFPFGEALAQSFDSIVPFYNYPTQMELPHHINHLTFHFSGIDWAAPHKVQYRYYLDGLENDWNPVSKENKADYRNLPYGQFTFKVQAIGEANVWSKPFQYSFTIRPPWWHSWWAYCLYLLAITSLLYALYRFLLNRQLEKAEAQRLKELDTFKSRLYTNITHEFRTPLTIILGMTDKLVTDPANWLSKGAEMIKRNGRNLLHLVNQMLDLSRFESGKLELNKVQGNVIPYLRYIVESFHSYAEAKEIQLHFHADTEELIMDYDPGHLLNIVSNLLSNALKFTGREGQVFLTVGNRLHKEDHHMPSSPLGGGVVDGGGLAQKSDVLSNPYLLLTIRDTGIGIPADKLPHIFDRFYQIDSSMSRKGEGTGIGLALTKELIKLMEGQIQVQSEVGKGTEFRVFLPIHQDAPMTRENGSNKQIKPDFHFVERGLVEASPPMETTEEKTNVLIVEDNPDVVQYLYTCLEGHYQIEVAYNGQEGINKALELVPDIIISDVMMPEKDGLELCQTLKSDFRTSHIPIVLLTAKADVESKISGLQQGADAYLAKPFNEQELLVRIDKLLELRSHLQKKYSSPDFLNIKSLPERESSLDELFLQDVRQKVEEHLLDYNLNVSKLCRLVAMSRTQLHRKLTALTGMSTTKFIRSIRLAKAREMLHDPNLSITEVAYDSGFSNPNYFSRAFSDLFGMSPTEYRNENRL